MRMIAAALLVALLVPLTASPAAADGCRYVLGFKTLHEAIPDMVGNCLDNEGYNVADGDALQHTTAWHGKGGLLVWRKIDNWTAFTDGANTWINGPYGIQKRSNDERFPWEKDPVKPAVAPSPSTTYQASAPASGVYRVNLSRKDRNMYKEAGGVLFFTRYCYEYIYGEDAIYDAGRGVIYFADGNCDIAQVVTKYLESYINGTFTGWEGSTVFPLGNGQVWQQAGYSYTYHYAYNPRVLIYEAGGAIWMRVADVDQAITVQRLR